MTKAKPTSLQKLEIQYFLYMKQLSYMRTIAKLEINSKERINLEKEYCKFAEENNISININE
jgi:hypothetical protein